MEKTHNLILVNHPEGQEWRDFDEIAGKVAALAPGIATHIVPHDAEADECGLPPDVWDRPTLAVAFRGPTRFRHKRGLLYAGRLINKFEQARKYHHAGVPTPPTMLYEFGRPLERSFWGGHVVMKPTRHDLMSRGDQVFLMRTERVAELAEKIYPSGHPARDKPVVVQRFIDTGEYPESYRVLTLFGEPLYCMRYRQSQRRVSLKGSDRELLQYSIASTAGGNYVHAMIDDAEVLAFARRAAAVMPAIPLQGIDIIRDARTGALYVLENNSGGNTWHFSSKMSAFGRSKLSREARIEQFGAFDIAAKVLAERTLKLAR